MKDRSKIDAINKKYDDQLKMYTTVKTSLKSIAKTESTINKIFNVACRMNKIIIHTYQFFKLYILHHYHNFMKIPVINKTLITMIMKTVCQQKKKDNRGRPFSEGSLNLKDKLNVFYDEYYKHLICEGEQLSYDGLSQMIEYEAQSILTCITNHIQEHFEDGIAKLIAVKFDKRHVVEELKNDKIKLREYLKKLSDFKDDIIYYDRIR
jgi:hypothetical protein